MATTEEMTIEANKTLAAMNDSLIEKSPLMLSVEISTREEAEEIMSWMYSEKNSPMKSKLLEILWDGAIVSKQESEAVRMIREGENYCPF